MTALPVEWVLVIHYGPSAHRATYGRNVREPAGSARYTKDYIQLSKSTPFLDAINGVFPSADILTTPLPLVYKWPTGSANGALAWSADRLHLKWDKGPGAPAGWRMSLSPADAVAETILGDPSHQEVEAAEREFELLETRGAGQPYLVAVKLRGEPSTLHVRAYVHGADSQFAWADIGLAPLEVQELAAQTSASSALAWAQFASGGDAPNLAVEEALDSLSDADLPGDPLGALNPITGRAVASYLRRPGFGLFFDPVVNHDAWSQPSPLPDHLAASSAALIAALEDRFPLHTLSDAEAETTEADAYEVEEFQKRIEANDYSVADTTGMVHVRGSAQRAFANSVKENYGRRCAITGIETADFLVASHIVPWSEDSSIRLDPANGICLSLVVDRAFEKGHLVIQDDLSVSIDTERIGGDAALLAVLAPYDGTVLRSPSRQSPRPDYLRRRRVLVARPLK